MHLGKGEYAQQRNGDCAFGFHFEMNLAAEGTGFAKRRQRFLFAAAVIFG
ncbi:MAG: hypothetical protein VYC47_01630 [Verrucomicrobiota bacterium]|nr:hypothetical protein [Verrucomicrobiota bacterium]